MVLFGLDEHANIYERISEARKVSVSHRILSRYHSMNSNLRLFRNILQYQDRFRCLNSSLHSGRNDLVSSLGAFLADVNIAEVENSPNAP
jgi:hypothetical protein